MGLRAKSGKKGKEGQERIGKVERLVSSASGRDMRETGKNFRSEAKSGEPLQEGALEGLEGFEIIWKSFGRSYDCRERAQSVSRKER